MLRGIYTLWLREMKNFRRSKSRIVSTISMPFFWIVLMGVGLGSAFRTDVMGLDYLTFMSTGIIGMSLLFNSIFSGVSVVVDRRFGFLKEVFVAPIPRSSIIVGKTLGGSTVAMITGMIVMLMAMAVSDVPIGWGIVPALVFMAMTSFVFIGVGLLIASRMESMEGFNMIMSFIMMPVFFLSGIFFPLNQTPSWMQAMSMANPLTYGVDGIRGSLLGAAQFPIWMSFSVLTGFFVVLIVLGSYFFRRMEV
jgi:ABC-2 type transport system permease protein